MAWRGRPDAEARGIGALRAAAGRVAAHSSGGPVPLRTLA